MKKLTILTLILPFILNSQNSGEMGFEVEKETKKEVNTVVVTKTKASTTNQSLSKNRQSIDRIVAKVGDEIILESDLEVGKGTKYSKKCKVLDKVLMDNFLFDKSKKDSIIINEEEVDAEVENRMSYFISILGSKEKLEDYYGKSVNDLSLYFRGDVKKKMLAKRAENMLLSGMEPSPKDVKDYYNSIPEDSIPYYNAEIQLAQIVFLPKITRSAKRKAINKANEIRNKISNHETSFETQALLYSDDIGTASEGGNLGWIRKGQMVPEFEQAAFSLEKGVISDVIETQFGLHIIEVIEKRRNSVNVRHILISPKADEDGIEVAKSLADSVMRLINDGKIEFSRAVERYSIDKMFKSSGGIIYNMETRSPYFEMNQLDDETRVLIQNINEGGISKPQPYRTQDRKVGYRIVKVVSLTKPHKASLKTDYYKLKNKVRTHLRDKALNNWISFYKNYIFIKIDDEYKQCAGFEKYKNDYN